MTPQASLPRAYRHRGAGRSIIFTRDPAGAHHIITFFDPSHAPQRLLTAQGETFFIAGNGEWTA